MSDYQRWEPLDDSTMQQSADGGWVLIGDYSCLKREAHILLITCQDLQSENARLQSEVERLTKAGDAMQTYISDFSKICKPQWDVRLAWEAAKLGIEE